jgi:hypothetical protein
MLRLAAIVSGSIVYFVFATVTDAQSVFVNSHILASNSAEGIHFRLSKDGQPPPFSSCVECDTEVGFQYDGTKIKTSVIALDEQSDWFLVQPGNIFSDATIQAGQFPAILNVLPPPQGGEVTVGPGEFYLGIRTGRGFVGPGQPRRNAYGWVHLRPENGALTMVQNVMSYNSRGIIVGTTTVVPEPAALALVAVAALFGLGLKRRQLRRPAGCQ